MFRKYTVRRMVIGGAVALMVTAGLAMAAMLLPATTNAQARIGFLGGPGDRVGWQDQGNHFSHLADALGISVEELEAATESARQIALEQAVAEGVITQEQADRMAERQGLGHRGYGGGGAFMGRGHMDGGGGGGAFLGRGHMDGRSLLSDALGISEEELESAMTQAHETAIAEALQEGRITQEQANVMAAHRALHSYVDKGEILAAALGLSTEELNTALDSGQSFRDLMQESGLDREALRSAITAAYQAAVDEAVAEGIISSEDAELLRNGTEAGLGCHGRRGGRGMQGQRGGWRSPMQDGSSNSQGGANRFGPQSTL